MPNKLVSPSFLKDKKKKSSKSNLVISILCKEENGNNKIIENRYEWYEKLMNYTEPVNTFGDIQRNHTWDEPR